MNDLVRRPDYHHVVNPIIDGNNSFVESHNSGYFEPFLKSQNPLVTLVSCSDSRVHPNIFTDDPTNKVFEIGNIGNQIETSEGSVDYGVLRLKTPVLLILGHSDCGAVKAVMNGYVNEPESITGELSSLEQILSGYQTRNEFEKEILESSGYDGVLITNNLPEAGFEKRLLYLTLANINEQVDVACKKYVDIIGDNFAVIGGFYDFKNELGMGQGKIMRYNVNGEITVPKVFD